MLGNDEENNGGYDGYHGAYDYIKWPYGVDDDLQEELSPGIHPGAANRGHFDGLGGGARVARTGGSIVRSESSFLLKIVVFLMLSAMAYESMFGL